MKQSVNDGICKIRIKEMEVGLGHDLSLSFSLSTEGHEQNRK